MESEVAIHQQMLEAACHAARIGGAVLQQWRNKFTVQEKGRFDLVTEADLASQKQIFDHLQKLYPAHQFVGEEQISQRDFKTEASSYRWVIDPLDGTTNYVHGNPYYAVSIGLEHRGELLVGAVYDPTRDEMFSALKGHGAFCNGKAIRSSGIEMLSEALVVASLPVCTNQDAPAVQRFLKALPAAQNVQRTGSASLNLCSVACSRIDAFWSSSLKPWDMAAGALIAVESGCVVSDLENQPFDVNRPSILCSTSVALHEELVALFN